MVRFPPAVNIICMQEHELVIVCVYLYLNIFISSITKSNLTSMNESIDEEKSRNCGRSMATMCESFSFCVRGILLPNEDLVFTECSKCTYLSRRKFSRNLLRVLNLRIQFDVGTYLYCKISRIEVIYCSKWIFRRKRKRSFGFSLIFGRKRK